MSLEIFLHHQSNGLCHKLNSNLQKLWKNPLDNPKIITPNHNVSEWLKLKLTESRGILGHFSFFYLEEFLWTSFSKSFVQHNIRLKNHCSIEKLTPQILTIFLYEVFSKNPSKFLTIRSYFEKENTTLETIKLQVFHQLSSLFLQYQNDCCGSKKNLSFEEHWKKNHYFFSRKNNILHYEQSIENEQKDLYNFLFGDNGYLKQYNDKSQIQLETIATLFKKVTKENLTTQKKNIHIFNLSQLNSLHRQAIIELSKKNDVYLYNLTVCLDIWEDIPTTNILHLWGTVAKENIFLWQEITQWAYSPEEPNRENDTLSSSLKILQQTIYQPFKQINTNNPETQCDNSLNLWKADSIEAEVLTTHKRIRLLLNQDPHLHLNEICIIVPNIQDYKSVIHYIYESFNTKNPNYLPFQIINQKNNSNALLKTLQTILNSFTEGLNRKSFFDLISNPLIMEKHQLTSRDLEDWSSFCDKINLYHNHDDNPCGFEKVLERYLLQDLLPDQPPYYFSVDTMLLLWKSLSNNLKSLQKLQGHSWEKAYKTVQNMFLFWIPTLSNNVFILEKFFSNLKQIKLRQIIQPSSKTIVSELLSFLSYFLKISHFESAKFLTGGIIVSSLQDIHSIPFKHTFILGLNLSKFPSKEKSNHLDLRNIITKRPLGQNNILIEEQYHLLEKIICTESSLTLSYLSQNIKKANSLNPSNIIFHLKQHLKIYCHQTLNTDPIISTNTLMPEDTEKRKNNIKTTKIKSLITNHTPISITHFVSYLKNPLSYALQKVHAINHENTNNSDNLDQQGFTFSNLDLYTLTSNCWDQLLTHYGLSKDKNICNIEDIIENNYQKLVQEANTPPFPFDLEKKEDLRNKFSMLNLQLKNDLNKSSGWISSLSLGNTSLSLHSKKISSVIIPSKNQNIIGELKSIFIDKTTSEEFWIYPIFSSQKEELIQLLYPYFFYHLASIENKLPNKLKIIVYSFKKKKEKDNTTSYSIVTKNYWIHPKEPFESLAFFGNFMNKLSNPNYFNFPFSIIFKPELSSKKSTRTETTLHDTLEKIEKEMPTESSYLNATQIIAKTASKKDLEEYYQQFKPFLDSLLIVKL